MHLQTIRHVIASIGLISSTSLWAAELPKPQVVGWVPSYGLEASAFSLNATPVIGQTLTRIGLQFWNPSADGKGVVLAPTHKHGPAVGDDSIARFRDWAHARKIKVLLTVYNNSQVMEKWDWDLARRGFKENRAEFIAALVAEMEKHKLDGIDIDLEGEGDHEADRADFARFIQELSALLKPKGKLLTVDSFHSPCDNAPNMSWWKDWLGQIDAIHSMGYQDLYEESTEAFHPSNKPVCENGAHLFKYSWQLQYGLKAGYRVDQIVLGQPTWIDKWGKKGHETSAINHINTARQFGAGVALWDLQLEAAGWHTAETWKAMHQLREKPGKGWQKLR